MQVKKITISTVAIFVLALTAVPSVVFAQRANGQAGTQSDTSQSAQGQNGVRAIVDQAAQQAGQQATNASDIATQIKNKSENTSLRVRQEVCEQKRTRLQTSTQTMYRGAESVRKGLDTMYDRVVAFYGNGQLTVADFETKIKAIERTKEDVNQQMITLQTREQSEVDCADAKTASRLEGDRLAGQGVKDTLKQYQTELVNLISSMRSASATGETSNE